MEPLLYSIAETGMALGIKRSTTYSLIAAKKLEVVKIGRRTLVTVASVKRIAGETRDAN